MEQFELASAHSGEAETWSSEDPWHAWHQSANGFNMEVGCGPTPLDGAEADKKKARSNVEATAQAPAPSIDGKIFRKEKLVWADAAQEDDEFDEIVGSLQEIVLSEDFEKIQENFLKTNSEIFEDDDENKLEYTAIF